MSSCEEPCHGGGGVQTEKNGTGRGLSKQECSLHKHDLNLGPEQQCKKPGVGWRDSPVAESMHYSSRRAPTSGSSQLLAAPLPGRCDPSGSLPHPCEHPHIHTHDTNEVRNGRPDQAACAEVAGTERYVACWIAAYLMSSVLQARGDTLPQRIQWRGMMQETTFLSWPPHVHAGVCTYPHIPNVYTHTHK